jgi:hypothetical protein
LRLHIARRPSHAYLGVNLATQATPPVKRLHYVHVLVLTAFVGPRPSRHHEAAHRDGDGINNRLSNLRWATYAEQHADKVRHGRALWGEAAPTAKLTAVQVKRMRRAYAAGGVTQRALADEYGVSRPAVELIVQRKRWKHIT